MTRRPARGPRGDGGVRAAGASEDLNQAGGMRPITEREIREVYELFERRWRRVPAMRAFALIDAREERAGPREPWASLRVWPHGAAGVRLWVTAWDTDRARLERLRDALPQSFADGPLVWDGVPLRGGQWWWIRMSDPKAGESVDDDEWSPASVREAGGGGPVPGGLEPVACKACGAAVMIPVNDGGPVICADCHALDEALAAGADDCPPPEVFVGGPRPMVHLLGADSRWWAPGYEPAKGPGGVEAGPGPFVK